MSVAISNLTKDYVAPDGSALRVIDVEQFTVDGGEQVALIGTSGSGKTTLLHLIAGLLAPDTGRIVFRDAPPAATAVSPVSSRAIDYRSAGTTDGVDICSLGEARRDVFRGHTLGYIFQTHHLLGGFTALENVLLGMSFAGGQRDPAWARYLLSEVGLSDRLNYKPAKLSVGQQQRVAVARALANRPKLVLADEPTGALDARNAQQVLDLIRKLCAEVGASLLLVTHDLDIARQLGRVVDLKELNRAAVETPKLK